MKSFTLRTHWMPCPGKDADQLMPFEGGQKFAPPAVPGAGVMPTNFAIRKVCVTHWIDGPEVASYLVAGHSGPNGDHVSRMLERRDKPDCVDYPADGAPKFSAGEYLDLHGSCVSGRHRAALQVWFTD